MAEKKKPLEAAAPASDKKKALETAMAQIEKAYGKGAIMRLGANPNVKVESIPTGSLALDLALGIGGVPRGRIIEIYGPESSGKTTLAMSFSLSCPADMARTESILTALVRRAAEAAADLSASRAASSSSKPANRP